MAVERRGPRSGRPRMWQIQPSSCSCALPWIERRYITQVWDKTKPGAVRLNRGGHVACIFRERGPKGQTSFCTSTCQRRPRRSPLVQSPDRDPAADSVRFDSAVGCEDPWSMGCSLVHFALFVYRRLCATGALRLALLQGSPPTLRMG